MRPAKLTVRQIVDALPPALPPCEVKRLHRLGLQKYPWRGGVYFIQWRAYVKVGCAWDVVKRRRALECSFPEGDMVALGWIPKRNYGRHEWQIHEALAAYRVRGEWFRDCSAVRRFIERYARPWPVAQ